MKRVYEDSSCMEVDEVVCNGGSSVHTADHRLQQRQSVLDMSVLKLRLFHQVVGGSSSGGVGMTEPSLLKSVLVSNVVRSCIDHSEHSGHNARHYDLYIRPYMMPAARTSPLHTLTESPPDLTSKHRQDATTPVQQVSVDELFSDIDWSSQKLVSESDLCCLEPSDAGDAATSDAGTHSSSPTSIQSQSLPALPLNLSSLLMPKATRNTLTSSKSSPLSDDLDYIMEILATS